MPARLRLSAVTTLEGHVTAVLKTDPHNPHQVACAKPSREHLKGIDEALGKFCRAVLCLAGCRFTCIANHETLPTSKVGDSLNTEGCTRRGPEDESLTSRSVTNPCLTAPMDRCDLGDPRLNLLIPPFKCSPTKQQAGECIDKAMCRLETT